MSKRMTEARREMILTHMNNLRRIFPLAQQAISNPIELYKHLHRLEAEAHSFAERECNEQLPDASAKTLRY